MLKKASKFLSEVRTEMSKVSWPSRQELKGQTWIVILVSLFFAAFIFLVDRVLSWAMNIIY